MAILQKALDEFRSTLDTRTCAWTLAVGRLLDGPPPRSVPPEAMAAAMRERDDYPAGPFPLTADTLVDGAGLAATEFDLDGRRHLRWAAFQFEDLVGEALTRTGCLDDGTVAPSHVMLSDVEAVLLDTAALLHTLARLSGYQGRCALLVDVACDVPDAPLELRVYDEGPGDLLRPPAGYDTFSPMRIHFDAGMPADELRDRLWNTVRDLATTFGVFEPQLMTRPARA